ncbi:SusC/RagA family TonB-linked outer membrane protein [Terrimonas alba]|uniref:SusC/RagA family TonB-linked outer membrane protein n=1 Tax=Terrimonas alba TaxID=3349636 RepID=UPI0035F35A06
MQKALSPPPGPEVARAAPTTNPAAPNSTKKRSWFKCFMMMKLVIALITLSCLHSHAKGYAQAITLSLHHDPIEKAFAQIEAQTDYVFVYTREEIVKATPLTLAIKNEELKKVLDICFTNQPLTYSIDGNHIVVRRRKQEEKPVPIHDIKGKITNKDGEPLPGITISIKGSKTMTVTDSKGEFGFEDIEPSAVLIISGAEIETIERKINGLHLLSITVYSKLSELDQVMLMAYGKTTQRLNTGNITRVSSAEISKQPVANPLAAIQGRVPGLIVTQSNGVPGSSFTIQIRGRNSIAQGSTPLLIIDGVPYAAGNNYLNQLTSAIGVPFDNSIRGGGLSPFNLVNPDHIESIEVLKDADATAIYGSRGANGVILITTRKGQPGSVRVDAAVQVGGSRAPALKMMNSEEYLVMRKEAFANDGITPNTTPGTSGYAPDILLWNAARYTNLQKVLIGKTGNFSHARASVSGGTAHTQYLVGSSYRHQTTVYPGDFSDDQRSFHISLNSSTTDKKLGMQLTANYATDKNNLLVSDLTNYLYLPPTLPSLYDSTGGLNWEEAGESFFNPLSPTLQKYWVKSDNLVSNLQLSYKLVKGLEARISTGYNNIHSDENAHIPKASIDPRQSGKASASFASNTLMSWIAEPQLEYTQKIKRGTLTALAGGTWQAIDKKLVSLAGQNYSSDALLESINGAGTVTSRNSKTDYRYNAVFGRLNYNWDNRYIVNVSGRRDGSSRFGPGRQFANFGAAGVAWIISNETFFKKSMPFFSFFKLRSSYGTTGNDQIGDYQFLDAWSPTYNGYQGQTGLYPIRLNNPDYSWEINRKFEAAVEMGFLKDRILLNISCYQNRSSNQLIGYSLPIQTGFYSVIKNFDALVENKGWEISLVSKNFQQANFKWETSFNISVSRNKLVSFPGLDASSYAYRYKEGKSLSVIQGFQYLGVDAATGVYQFEDIDKDGNISFPNDYVVLGNTDPRFYGGLQNTLKYKNLELSIFLEFRKQKGRNHLYNQLSYLPGRPFNQPTVMLDRWQQAGDNSEIQKYTAGFGDAYVAAGYLSSSGAIYSDASYIRGKNISLSYLFPGIGKHKRLSLKAFMLAQNLFAITGYKGADPETQNLYALPPLKTITAGLQVQL